MKSFFRFAVAVLAALSLTGSVWAETGVTKEKILFGQTAATGGPASALGIGMRDGILAAFQEFNNKGGVNGIKLEMTTLDDGYEPDLSTVNTKELIYEDKVFALIGGVGTPTANAIEPIISTAKVPFIGPFTGAEFLRNPFKRYVVNLRASYWQETEEWIERLTTDLGIKRIAIFYQDDSYGQAGLSGVQRAMKKRGLELVAEGTYKRNTTAVNKAAIAIAKAKPEAVLMVGAYNPCAEFIKIAKRLGLASHFINISFVGSEALARSLGKDGSDTIISQVVPFPFDTSQPLISNYQNALRNYDPRANIGFVSLEGYMVGRFTIEILKNIQGPITREAFIDTIYRIKTFNIDGVTITYGEDDNQGMDKVFLTKIDEDGKFRSIKRLD